jgi:hypothetical protein
MFEYKKATTRERSMNSTPASPKIATTDKTTHNKKKPVLS